MNDEIELSKLLQNEKDIDIKRRISEFNSLDIKLKEDESIYLLIQKI